VIDLGRIEATREHLLADTFEIAIAFGAHDAMSMSDALGLLDQSPRAQDELMNSQDEDIDDDGYPEGVS
jgi:hypothetical protein